MITALRNTVSFAVAAAATLLIVAGSAAPVSAATIDFADARTEIIDTSGINLASAAGFTQMQTQITRTARRLCQNGDNRSLAGQLKSRECVKLALAANARGSRTIVADAALPTASVSR